jgi:hypothetical protein
VQPGGAGQRNAQEQPGHYAVPVPGVEQEVQAYYEEPYALQRAEAPREQPQPEISPEPRA